MDNNQISELIRRGGHFSAQTQNGITVENKERPYERNLLQIISADGWQARYHSNVDPTDGTAKVYTHTLLPLAAWALAEVIDESGEEVSKWNDMQGMVVQPYGETRGLIDFAEDVAHFAGYVSPQEIGSIKRNDQWDQESRQYWEQQGL